MDNDLTPQTIQGIEVALNADVADEPGSIACAIQRSAQPDRTYIISCRHVFSLSATRHPEQDVATVRLRGGGRALAATRMVTGVLQNAPDLSFDAQLAAMTDAEVLRLVLNGVRWTDFARTQDDFPPTYWILTSHGPVEVRRSAPELIVPMFSLDYQMPNLARVVHKELAESLFTTSARTMHGDSGSPVATQQTGGVLLGMHIAGDNERTYTIPAWQLLSPVNYLGTASETETWSLVNAEELTATSPTSGVPTHSPGSPLLASLTVNHGFENSVEWRLAQDGIRIADAPPEVTQGEPQTVGQVWNDFHSAIEHWGAHFDVPVELIIATICTESTGNRTAVRQEPGFISDQATPHKVSVGLMQTLISTARETLGDSGIDRQWLLDPDHSIQAGTAYIAQQKSVTASDPPKVACAYNAGSLRWNNAPGNRWKMRQFPRDTGEHADRFVKWFNDCFRLFGQLGLIPTPSFRSML